MIRLSRSIVFNYSAPFSLVFSGEALRSRPAKRSTESNPIEFDSKTWTREREVFVGPLGMTRFFYFLSPFFSVTQLTLSRTGKNPVLDAMGVVDRLILFCRRHYLLIVIQRDIDSITSWIATKWLPEILADAGPKSMPILRSLQKYFEMYLYQIEQNLTKAFWPFRCLGWREFR